MVDAFGVCGRTNGNVSRWVHNLRGCMEFFFHFDQELHTSVIESNPQDRVNIPTFVNSCFDRMHPGSVWVLSCN